jgi:hypothetical protein|tara:strand:- start:291 stop:539 length:249 start_codon:yes stop_codon:yes gene_type:complete
VKLFVLILYLGVGSELYMMHPVQVTEEQCKDPHEENLFEYRVVKDGDAELDRYFYYDYVVFGSYCAGLIGSIENIPNTLPLN